jgi:hypothetical protein
MRYTVKPVNNINQIISDNSEPGTIKRKSLNGSPDEIVHETLRTMVRLANRDKDHAMIQNIVKQVKDCCTCCEIENIYKVVVDNIQYVSDPVGEEYVRAPIHCLKERAGDCDDMSTLFACLCKALNIPVMYKAIAWRRHEYTHVYCLAYMKKYNTWVVCDPVMKKFGKEKSGIKRSATIVV